MGRIDLDAARKARAEQAPAAEPNTLTLDGNDFELVQKAPAGFLVALGRVQKGDLSGIEEALLSVFVDPEDVTRALKLGLDMEDLELISKEIFGIELGESSASGS